jgi:hypothetical protein
MFEISKEDIAKLTDALKEQRQQLDSVIRSFLIDGLSHKQTIELCQVGKFITLLNKPSQIITHGDSPDFIISYNGEKIGLEHERVFKTDKVEAIKSVGKLFEDAAELFKKNYPDHKLLANCWLNTDNFTFKKSEAEKIKVEISEYIFNLVSNNLTADKPSYIDRVRIMKHSKVNFGYNPGGNVVTNINKETLETPITKKNHLVDKYKSNSGVDKQWLLIVIGSTSPDSFEYEASQFAVEVNSKFDRVFLMEDFNAKAWQLL